MSGRALWSLLGVDMTERAIIPTTEDLNALTDAGIISDNAVAWDDVAPCDQERALKWLAVQKGELL